MLSVIVQASHFSLFCGPWNLVCPPFLLAHPIPDSDPLHGRGDEDVLLSLTCQPTGAGEVIPLRSIGRSRPSDLRDRAASLLSSYRYFWPLSHSLSAAGSPNVSDDGLHFLAISLVQREVYNSFSERTIYLALCSRTCIYLSEISYSLYRVPDILVQSIKAQLLCSESLVIVTCHNACNRHQEVARNLAR